MNGTNETIIENGFFNARAKQSDNIPNKSNENWTWATPFSERKARNGRLDNVEIIMHSPNVKEPGAYLRRIVKTKNDANNEINSKKKFKFWIKHMTDKTKIGIAIEKRKSRVGISFRLIEKRMVKEIQIIKEVEKYLELILASVTGTANVPHIIPGYAPWRKFGREEVKFMIHEKPQRVIRNNILIKSFWKYSP